MHSKMMRFLIDSSVVVSVILALLVGGLIGGAADSFGVGFIVFIIVLIIAEMGLASEGMKVEQAENMAKIAYNTEQIVKLLDGGQSMRTSSQTGNVNNARVAVSKNWICQYCGDRNAVDSLFCKNCGEKRMY